MLKSSSSADGLPPKIAKQVKYNLYFPSPMPPGYVYMKDSATFQIGQVFYKFSNGKKRVTVREEPLTDTRPNLSLFAGFSKINSPIGEGVLGMVYGEPQAVIVTDTTVITMNAANGVSKTEMQTAISNLKNIGQNPDAKK